MTFKEEVLSAMMWVYLCAVVTAVVIVCPLSIVFMGVREAIPVGIATLVMIGGIPALALFVWVGVETQAAITDLVKAYREERVKNEDGSLRS